MSDLYKVGPSLSCDCHDRAALVAALRHCLAAIEMMKRDLFEDTKAVVDLHLTAAQKALGGMP